MNNKGKPELLAPAGDFEKLKVACAYGADAVYLGGEKFSLRAAAENFNNDDLTAAVRYAHDRGVSVYAAVNILARTAELNAVGDYISFLYNIGTDAILVSDPGVFMTARERAPDLDIHISTQASVTNCKSVKFWADLGAKRIVLARELPLDEIKEIAETAPEELKIEAFVHGAMCISYSGRCLLSNYMSRKDTGKPAPDRDANAGACMHPCRYEYALVEQQRPDEYFPISEDAYGTYILSSKDLCMAAHIPDLINAGISAFKIEGRMKSAYYAAVTAKIYREAIDDYCGSPEKYRARIGYYMEELQKTDNRGYTTGFYFKQPDGGAMAYTAKHGCGYIFAGIVEEYDYDKKLALITQKNKFSAGQTVEFISPKRGAVTHKVTEMYDTDGSAVSEAPHPKQRVWVRCFEPLARYDIMRILQKQDFMRTIIKKINKTHPEADSGLIKEAAEILKNGGLAAFPTETVYGLGAVYDNAAAVEKIYAAKGRPFDNPLILHICEIETLKDIAREIPDTAYALADAFWPGPMTLILKKNKNLPDTVTRGLDTVAVRLPENAAARLLIKHAGILAAPSANVSGSPSPTCAAHVAHDLSGKIDIILDGGGCEVGLESTIIDVTGGIPVILRPGGITPDMIKSAAGDCKFADTAEPDRPIAPGMKYTHYAPKAKVTVITGSPGAAACEINRRIAENPGIKTGVLVTDETRGLYDRAKVTVLTAGSRRTPDIIARNLYRCLREFDDKGCERIYAEGLTGTGIEAAVMNRLTKAAGGDAVIVES